MTVDETIAQLRRTVLFADADPGRLAPLASRAFVRRFSPGQVVFSEGEPSDHLYVIRSGRVRILVRSVHGVEMTLSLLGSGDTMGELSVIDGRPRSASAEALSQTELVTLPAVDVASALRTDPALLFTAAGELAGMVRRLTGGTADLIFLDLPRRLAKLLLTEATHEGAGPPRLNPGMSQSGLAARLGVTRQSLNRALAGLVRREWIRLDGGAYVLCDPAALRRFANS